MPFDAITSVFQAVAQNDPAALKQALAGLNETQECKGALVNAAEKGSLELVKCFIHAKVQDDWAVVAAASFGHLKVMRYLMRFCGGNINAALIAAAAHGQEKAVRLLLKRNPASLDEALADAALRGYLGIVKMLVKNGADPQALVYGGQTARQLALQRGHQDVCRYFQQHTCPK